MDFDNMNNNLNNESSVQNASYDQPDYSDFGDSDDVSSQNNFMSNPMIKKLIIAIAVIVAIILIILLFSVLFKDKKINLDIPNVVYKDSNVEFITAVANKTNSLFYEFSSSNEEVLQFEYKNLSAGDSSNTLIPRSVGKSTINVVAYDKGKKVGTYSSEVIVCGAFNSSSFGNDTSKVGVGDRLNLTMDLGTEDVCYKKIKYSSSNDEIATVSNSGEVSALSAGNVDITVDNGYTKITKKITVVSAGNINSVDSVKLNTTNLTVQVGKYAFLYATVSPSSATNKSVVWTSSNDSVAMVSNKGQVVGVKAGNAVITATTQDGNKTAMAKVTVKKAPSGSSSGGSSSGGSSTGGSSGSKYKKVTKVAINSKNFTLVVGKTKKLTYTISPKNATNKKVTWKSSNPAIAKISTSGKVTGVRPGTATISAVGAGGVSGKVKVTVKNASSSGSKEVAVTGLALSKTSVSLKKGSSVTVSSVVVPSNATNKKVTWKSSNTSVATVSNGRITGVGVGTAKVTATAGKYKKTVSVTVTSASSVKCTLQLVTNKGTNVSNYTKVCTSSLTINANCTSTGGVSMDSIELTTNTGAFSKSSVKIIKNSSTNFTAIGVIDNSRGKYNGTHSISVKGKNKNGIGNAKTKTITITGYGSNCGPDTTKPYISSDLHTSSRSKKMKIIFTAADSKSGIAMIKIYYKNLKNNNDYTKTYKSSTYPKSWPISYEFSCTPDVRYSYHVVIFDKAGNKYSSDTYKSNKCNA